MTNITEPCFQQLSNPLSKKLVCCLAICQSPYLPLYLFYCISLSLSSPFLFRCVYVCMCVGMCACECVCVCVCVCTCLHLSPYVPLSIKTLFEEQRTRSQRFILHVAPDKIGRRSKHEVRICICYNLQSWHCIYIITNK